MYHAASVIICILMAVLPTLLGLAVLFGVGGK